MNSSSSLSSSGEQLASSFTKSAHAKGLDPESATKLAVKLEGFLDRQLVQLTQAGVPLDCKPKCTFCCHQIVYATAPEIARIWKAMQDWPEEKIAAFKERASAYNAAIAPHRPENFLRVRAACPFLVDDLCEIYEDRPIACRGLTSQFVQLCQDWFDFPSEAHNNFGPNGEIKYAAGMLKGIQDALVPPDQDRAPLELAVVLLQLIDNPSLMGELLKNPARFVIPRVQSWRKRFAPPFNDPIAFSGFTQGFGRFQDELRDRDLHETLKHLSEPTTANMMARIIVPSVYRNADEVPYWRAHFEKAIDDAAAFPRWDPREAYHALSDLRPVAAGYQPYSMAEPMKKIGAILHDRIAAKIAPELLDRPKSSRQPGKIRVGIASNIGSHSVSKWTLGWVKGLDRSKFEVYALKISGAEDAATYEFKDFADHFYRLAGHPLEIARFVRSLDLDYLIYSDIGDLGVQYQLSIFRLARVQATAWGCPFTSGLPTVDYYLSSSGMEGPNAQEEYSEKLILLPNTGLTLAPFRRSAMQHSRSDFGFPEGFLATYPQYIIKWLPQWDYLLKEITDRTKNPIVLFDMGAPYERHIFNERMERSRIPVLWMPRLQPMLFQRAMQLCDVAIDSPDWSGGLSSIDALRAGVPFVNIPGQYLRQRLAKAFVEQAKVPSLVAQSVDDYIDLATSRVRLAAAMEGLDSDLLFEDQAPLKALEEHILEAIRGL